MSRFQVHRLAGLAIAAVVLAVQMQPAQSAEKTVIKLGWATSDAEQDSFAIAARAFKKALEDGNGDFAVELYPNRQIGDEKQLAEGLRLGTVDAAVITNAAYSQIEPAFQVNDLPFLYGSEAKVFEAMDGALGKTLASKLDRKGVVLLSYLAGGYRHMLNNRQPVLSPADVAGVKYRVHNAVAIDLYTALGASPVPMAWGETTTALQQGAVDGLDLPIGVMESLKINEVVKHLSLTGHTYSGAAIGMSKRRFDRLTDEQKAAVREAATAAANVQRRVNAENEQVILKSLAAKGLLINDVPDAKPFRDKVLPLYEKMRASVSSEVLDAALAAAGD